MAQLPAVGVQAQLAALTQMVVQLWQEQVEIKAELLELRRLAARSYNRQVAINEVLAPVPAAAHVPRTYVGSTPPAAPATTIALLQMTGQQANTALTQYGLGIGGDERTRRTRLAAELGVRMVGAA